MTYKPTCVSRAGHALIRGDVGPFVDLFSGAGIDTDDHNAVHKRTADWEADDRGYADKAGTNFLLPTSLPVNPPATDAALIQLVNIPKNMPLADRFGDGGFALVINSGILRNKGESWLLKWMLPTAVGTLEDARSYSMADGADATYYYIDGYECSDSKGRNLTRVPIRVFGLNAFAQGMVTNKTCVAYIRDQDGLAWSIAQESTNQHRTAVAVTDWSWVTTNKLGKANFRDSDLTGVTAGESETTFDVSLIATLSNDPNIHIGDVVVFTEQEDDTKVAVSGYLDSKIKTVEMWSGTTANIKAGWVEYNAMAGRFPVGTLDDDGDYGTPGTTGGSHPIRPHEHSSGQPLAGTYGANNWDEAEWDLDDHPEQTCSETEIGITVATHPERTCSESTTHLTIANHALHQHGPETASSAIDEVGGVGAPGGIVTTNEASPGGEHTHAHTFSVAVTEVWMAPDPTEFTAVSAHAITDPGHEHTCPPMTHSVTNTPHDHTISPLVHSGKLTHREEDYRPPWLATIFIERVGPDDD